MFNWPIITFFKLSIRIFLRTDKASGLSLVGLSNPGGSVFGSSEVKGGASGFKFEIEYSVLLSDNIGVEVFFAL